MNCNPAKRRMSWSCFASATSAARPRRPRCRRAAVFSAVLKAWCFSASPCRSARRRPGAPDQACLVVHARVEPGTSLMSRLKLKSSSSFRSPPVFLSSPKAKVQAFRDRRPRRRAVALELDVRGGAVAQPARDPLLVPEARGEGGVLQAAAAADPLADRGPGGIDRVDVALRGGPAQPERAPDLALGILAHPVRHAATQELRGLGRIVEVQVGEVRAVQRGEALELRQRRRVARDRVVRSRLLSTTTCSRPRAARGRRCA